MADILPGYTWNAALGRYRQNSNGRFVARNRILSLLRNQIDSGEQRLRDITTEFHEGRLSASVWTEQMRTQVKRLYLQNAALGSGGWDRLDSRDYGRIGGKLRAEYSRISDFARAVQSEDGPTLPQALNRVDAYVGGSRIEFFETERRSAQPADENETLIERRRLDPGAQHCRDCPGYYDQGWQMAGELPVPGVRCQCRNNCRCSIDRRSVENADIWIGTKR